MNEPGMDTLLREVVFAVDGTPYLGGDVVLAAKRWGEWTSLEEQVRQGVACLRRLTDSGEVLAPGDVESVAREFRYERNLISGQEMEAWLGRWALTLDEWTEYLRRSRQ